VAENNLTDVGGKLAKAGITITAPGLSGSAELLGPDLQLRTPGGQLFHNALANSGLSATTHIALGHSTPATDQVTISVPKRAPGSNALLLIHDSTGALSLHKPDGISLRSSETVPLPPGSAAASADDGMTASAAGSSTTGPEPAAATGTVSFTVAASRFGAGNQHVGLLSRIAGLVEHFHFHPGLGSASKVLSVVEYPVEHLAGELGAKWFADWENNKHPSVIRWFPAEGNLSVGEPLSPTNWHQLAQGPTLLFIHGIFSSCEAGFAGIGHDTSTWPQLRERYRNRIIGFDHPTASVQPADNAKWFLDQIPEKVELDLDIVCHSRGGLVARSIADQAAQRGMTVNIRRIVFAATPNGGSQITVTQNWESLVNRISSVLTLPAKVLPAPADAISGVLAGLLEVLKIVAVGVALDLPGLEAMTPGSQFLKSLGQATKVTPEYFAAFADFEPGPILANLFNGLDDEARVVDSAIFDGVHNDIAIPTEGVWNPASVTDPNSPPTPIPGFPIDDPARRLVIGPGSVYWHCDYFDDPAMRTALLQWLPG
jgi:pimeloyl-ACP methyl ester carboxylesterase